MSDDSAETMRCEPGKQAMVDAVPDSLESKCALPSNHNLSLLERIMRLRERIKGEIADAVWSARSDEDDDKDDDWGDWNKKN